MDEARQHPARQPRAARRSAWPALALAACALPWAAPAQAQGTAHDLAHQVRPGDTLEALSLHYLGEPRLWPQLQRHNRVPDPRRLQPGSVLRIPMHLLPLGSAEVLAVQGDARVGLPRTADAQPAQAGQPLPEGASVQAGPDSFVSVRLADGTVVRVQADSQVQLEQLRRRGRAGDAQSIWQLQRGSVEPTVPPRPDGARRFEIRTPSASTAVRGTRFVVTLAPDGRTLAAVTEGTLAVAPGTAPDALPATAALVPGGQGLVVQADGSVGAPRPLLAPPGLAGVPATLEEADFLRLPLEPVAGAARYQVQVARDAQFTDVVRSAVSDQPLLRLPALEDGAYHVAARAIDAQGLPGRIAQRPLAVKAHPVAPLLQAPGAGATLARGQGELRCTPVAGVARYRIQVAGGSGFAAPLLDETRPAQCALPVAALAPGRYAWRVASVRELPAGTLDQGPFSASQPFAVAEQPQPVSAGAIDASEAGTQLHLRWPGEPGQRFQVQIAATQDFAGVLVDEQLTEPAWTVPASVAPGLHYVRIRTLDPSGLQSAYSTPREIRVPAPVRSSSGLPVGSSDGRPLSAP